MDKHLQNFNIVHAALAADRYRLIAKDEAVAPGETPRHFTHGKKNAGPEELTETGAFRGWTQDEVRAHMHEVVEAAIQDSYGTYITPLAADTHYILIDDINTPEKLEKSTVYAAALEVESSPGNRQKVLKIKADPDPALARRAANACAARINQECGDPAVRNGEQAWRLPGFLNNKPKHRAADGSA
ncbi:DNA-primase RepB domain-containing protein, partial [Desulfovibrio sp. 1214_IL3152]